MAENEKSVGEESDLRARAERAMQGKGADAVLLPEDGLSLEEMRRLVHELRVHKIELEMQNEELKRSEILLAASRDRYQALYDFAPVGYFTFDEKGTVSEVNLTGSEFLGVERSRLIGKRFQQFMAPESGDAFYLHQRLVFSQEDEKHKCDLKLVKADGSTFYVQMESMASMSDRDREQSGRRMRTAVIDITERKRAEEEKERLERLLRQAQKMEAIGTLAGGIAHDFNNILAAILGYTEIVLDEIPEHTPAHDDLENVLTAAHRAKELVKQIMAFSRQGQTHARQPILIATVMEEALKMLRETLPSSIELRQEISENCGTVLGNATQLCQVVVNLGTNAAHAMSDGGGLLEVIVCPIYVDTAMVKMFEGLLPGPYVRLTVKDTGSGMDPAILDRIFDPYFTTKGVGEGRGLGLAVAKGIVQRHGGTVTVRSQLEKGTVFEIFLPQIGRGRESTRNVDRTALAGTERILLVDDEKTLALLGERILTQLGYRVTAKSDSLEAFESFRADPNAFDLVVTDYTMPNMTGVDLAAEIHGVRPDIPVVLCSGYSEMVNEGTVKEFGVQAFIMKPIERREMAKVVRRLLDEKEP